MRYPKLVPDRVCKTPIHVKLFDEEITDRGSPITAFEADLCCNLQDGAKTVLTDKQKLVEISGVALFNDDIAPSLAVISGGEAELFGATRRILRGIKARDPDGTVNYTRLELI